MSRPRKNTFAGWLPGLYQKEGRRGTLYYTLNPNYISLGHNLSVARKKLLELQEVRYSVFTIGGLLDEFMTYRKDKSERTGRPAPSTVEGNLVEVVQLKATFGHMMPADLTTQHVWQYLHLERGKIAPVRANREISLLSSGFRYGVNRGLVQSNPCIGVEKNVEHPRTRAVTLGELDSFCDFTRGNRHQSVNQRKREFTTGQVISLASRLAFLTAKAESQILQLQMTDVRTDGIFFKKRKRGHETLVEWTLALRQCVDALAAVRAASESPYLVQTQDGGAYTLSGFISVWRPAMTAWVNEEGANSPRTRFTFHDLRAMAITHLKSQGRDPKLLSGHTTDKIPDRVYDRGRERRAKAVM